MLYGNPQANRSAVIENVDCEPLQADNFGEAADRPRQIVERITEVIAGRHVRLTKAGQVGGHEVKAVSKERNQIAEHVAGARKAVQQEQCRSVGAAGFAVEYFEAVNFGRTVIDASHGRLPEEVYERGLWGSGYPSQWPCCPTRKIEIAVDN